jgi:hypothetical protein
MHATEQLGIAHDSELAVTYGGGGDSSSVGSARLMAPMLPDLLLPATGCCWMEFSAHLAVHLLLAKAT